MTRKTNHKRILALDIRPRRFGFVAFEQPDQLIDWGVKSFRRGVNAVRIPPRRKLAGLLDELSPAVVVLNERVLRVPKKKYKIVAIAQEEARRRRIAIRTVPRNALKRAFAGHHRNKDEIASVLVDRFPELAMKQPPRRRPWQSEDYRMSVFDAAALAATYLGRGSIQNRAGLALPQSRDSFLGIKYATAHAVRAVE
jgi:hypothetical protein